MYRLRAGRKPDGKSKALTPTKASDLTAVRHAG